MSQLSTMLHHETNLSNKSFKTVPLETGGALPNTLGTADKITRNFKKFYGRRIGLQPDEVQVSPFVYTIPYHTIPYHTIPYHTIP